MALTQGAAPILFDLFGCADEYRGLFSNLYLLRRLAKPLSLPPCGASEGHRRCSIPVLKRSLMQKWSCLSF
jgi:hypothetical protein